MTNLPDPGDYPAVDVERNELLKKTKWIKDEEETA